jgi:hypothetical protein
VRKSLVNWGNCTTSHFIIFAPPNIRLTKPRTTRWLAKNMQAINENGIKTFSYQTWMYEKTLEILALKERWSLLEILKKYDIRIWTEFIMLMLRSRGRLLWTR